MQVLSGIAIGRHPFAPWARPQPAPRCFTIAVEAEMPRLFPAIFMALVLATPASAQSPTLADNPDSLPFMDPAGHGLTEELDWTGPLRPPRDFDLRDDSGRNAGTLRWSLALHQWVLRDPSDAIIGIYDWNPGTMSSWGR